MKPHYVQIAASILTASFVFVGCGKKKEKNNHAPQKPSVEIVGIESSGAGMKTLKYRSDIEGVTFECKVSSSTNEGTWEPCSDAGYQLRVDGDGAAYFSVRALKDGLISEVANRLISAGNGNAQQPAQTTEPFQAQILDKTDPSALNQAQNSPTVQIRFTAKGVDLASVVFECLVEDGSQQQNYQNGNNGQSNGQTNQQYNNNANWQSCQSPHQLSRGVSGVFPTFTVRPKNTTTGEYGQEDTLQFPQSNLPIQGAVTEMLIGREYKFVVPQGMHVTEYASNANQNGVVDGYRIRTESDRYYVGNTRCRATFEDDFLAISPSGQPLRYCNFTPNDDIFKFMTDARWANSHLAVGTDQQAVDQNPYNNEHIVMNLFGADPEFRRSKTRFWDLCKNALGGSIRTVDRPITMLRNFWGERVRTEFYMCDTLLNVRQPNGLPKAEVFRVGAFFVTDEDLDFAEPGPGLYFDPRCVDCSYNYPHLLEVVYIARANSTNETPGFFAQYAQRKFEQHLYPVNYRTVGF